MFRWLRRAFGARDAEALYGEGEQLAVRHSHAAAEALFRRAIAQDASQARYHFALGCVLQASGRSDAAVECYGAPCFSMPPWFPR